MSGYYFNGVNISDLIQSGTSAPPSNVYAGFPTSTAPTYKATGLDKPYNFSFQYNGSDVSNYATAYGIGFNAGTSGAIPISIPGAPGYSFKHISGYCYGGGGGGGGGGGKNGSYGGGDGGTGGNGAFAAIVDYPISGSTVNYQSGSGGGGGRGENSNKGYDGSAGGNSFINIGATTILFANGGGGGGGGATANSGANSKPGTAPSGGNGSSGFAAGYTGTTANTSPATSYPNNPSNGGGGGNASYNSGVNSGGNGSPGYLYVYLTYQP